jgi:enhancing lycopene biosynthesis protein 2
MFEPGFGAGKRLVNFAYKGAVFSVIGLLAGIIGTSISNGLLTLR